MTSPNMDPATYMATLGTENQGGDGYGASMRQTAMAAAPAHRAVAALTPSKAALAGWGALAAAAGNTQEALSTLSAQATVTEARMGKLKTGMDSLARSYGIGNSGARELYTTLSRLGTISAGTEGNVAKLASTFTRLSGAVGEGSSGLASGFIMLNRSMSTGFDAARMSKLGDSLTVVAAKSGASATGILQFAKVIAPMAQATGIGETKVLGISAAFSKMGDDGVGAATAFNKMLGDLNRSIRDGSPMINTYAQIVGKTTDQFSALVKTNPAEAITQVTEALGKSGGNAPRQLEQLGLDGVRTQRYLQELSQSGGLRTAIAQSTGAYGGGATGAAAEKAFHTWADSTQKAAANAQQLGEAIGAPLLGPLGKFTDAMGAAITPFRAAAQSKIGQYALEAGAALLLFAKVLRPMGTAMMFGGAATSGPVRSFFGGMANARGAGPGSLLYRMGGGVSPLVASGADIGRGAMIPVNSMFARFGGAAGTALTAVNPGTGPGAFAQMRAMGVGGFAAWNRGTSELIRNVRLPAEDRFTRLTPRAGFGTGGRAAGAVFDSAHAAMVANEAAQRGGLITPGEQLRMNLAEMGKVRGALTQMSPLQQAAMTGRAMAAPYGQAAASGAALAGRGLMGAMGGPWGLALMGASTVGMMAYKGHQAREADFAAAKTSTSVLDDYRVAMGKATQSTSTFAGKMDDVAAQLTSQVTTMQQATTVDATARRIAGQTAKQVTTYAGDASSVAAGLRTQVAGGAAPDELARMRTDLIKQFGASKAQDILTQVRGYSGTEKTDITGDLKTQVRGIGNAEGAGGWRGKVGWANTHGLGMSPLLQHGWKVWKWGDSSNASTSGADVDTMSKAQKDQVRSVVADLETRRQKRMDAGGEAYGNSRARKEIDAAVQGAIDSGNDQVLFKLENEIQSKYGAKGRRVSASDIKKAGGFSNWEAQHSGQFKDVFGSKSTDAQAQEQQNQLQKMLTGNALGKTFMGTAVQNLVGPNGQPESPQAQQAALQAVMGSAGGGQKGLQELAANALAAANALGDVTDAGKLALAAFAQAAQNLQANAVFQTSGGAAMSQAQLYATMASQTPTNDTTAGIQKQGVAGLQSVRGQAVQAAQARLQQVRQFQIQQKRSEEDFQRQLTYGDADYKRQRERAEYDYGVTVGRTQRSYLIQMADAEADFQRQVSIANRDFNKQMKREAEDAAKSMYDPYQRIQAKGVWDPTNLAMNMGEQNKAMSDQIGNLGKARKAGLSDATITMLGLNDPSNAQQLANIIGQLVADPKIAQTLNSQAAQKQSLASALLGDPSNASFQRQKQDFTTAMNDQATAYGISVQRAKRNLHITLSDMAQDQATALSRSYTDYQTTLTRMRQANTTMITRAGEDLANSQQQIVGTLDQLTTALGEGTKVKVDTWKGILQDGMKDWVVILQAFQKGDWAALVNALGAPAFSTPASSSPAAHHDPDMGRRHAMGAIFNRPVFSRTGRDVAGEAEPELVLPLDTRGARFLSDTMARMGSPLEARAAAGAAHTTVVHNMQTYHYDSSVRPEKVILPNVRESAQFAEDMRQKAARDRSTRPAVLR